MDFCTLPWMFVTPGGDQDSCVFGGPKMIDFGPQTMKSDMSDPMDLWILGSDL